MKTKLIIPEHLQGEYEKRIGNKGKPIEIYECLPLGSECFESCDFADELEEHRFTNLIVTAYDERTGGFGFIATVNTEFGVYKGHLNSGTYPDLTVTIPEHLKHHLPERKPIEFVCRFKLEQFEPEPPSPNTFDNVMFMGKRECGRDLFTVWNDNCPAITVSYLGHLNDGYISE
jgi:hypothetical protein